MCVLVERQLLKNPFTFLNEYFLWMVFITRIKTVESARSISEYSRTLFFLQSKNPLSSRCKQTSFSMYFFLIMLQIGSKLTLLWCTYLFFNCLGLAQYKRGKLDLSIVWRKSRSQPPWRCWWVCFGLQLSKNLSLNSIPITAFYFLLFLHNAPLVPFSLRAQPDMTQNYTLTEETGGHGHCTGNILSGCDL